MGLARRRIATRTLLLIRALLRRTLTVLLHSLLLRCAVGILSRRLVAGRNRGIRCRRRGRCNMGGCESALRTRGLVAEHHARIHRALPDGGGAVRWRWLVRRRNSVYPDAAHPGRRTMAVRNTRWRPLCFEDRRGYRKAGNEYSEMLHGAPRVVSHILPKQGECQHAKPEDIT